MECPGEDLERLNSPWLSRPAWEFPRSSARRMEMFSVCLAAAAAQGASIFRALFLYQRGVSAAAWNACSWDGSGHFITVCTRRAALHFVIRKNV